MNKFSKILGGATVAVLATMNAKAVEVKHFEAQIYEAANMEEITKQDPFLTVAIKVFQDSYRAHLDELRAKENPSDLLRTDNYKYFLTINKVIIEEMIKMAFGIEVAGDSVNYVKSNKDKVIECISGGNIYKSIELYNASNWNYLLLINVLNQVKHSEQQIDEQLIKNTAELIAKQDKYSEYKTQLANAIYDLQHYFNELELYGYLEKTRAIKWDDSKFEKGKRSTEQENTTKADSIRRMQALFKNLTTYVQPGMKGDDNIDEDKVDIFEADPKTLEGQRQYTIDLPKNRINTEIAGGDTYNEINLVYSRAFLQKNSKEGFMIFQQLFLGYDLHVLYKLRRQFIEKIPLTLLTQAQETGLSADEKTYLDMWNIKMFLLACGFNEENIMYDRKNMFWVTLRKMLSDLEDQLLPVGTVIPGNKELSDLYEDKIDEILKKIKE